MKDDGSSEEPEASSERLTLTHFIGGELYHAEVKGLYPY